MGIFYIFIGNPVVGTSIKTIKRAFFYCRELFDRQTPIRERTLWVGACQSFFRLNDLEGEKEGRKKQKAGNRMKEGSMDGRTADRNNTDGRGP